MKYIKFMPDICKHNEEGEYNLHREFSDSITKADEECVEQIKDYINHRQNPFEVTDDNKLINIVTGATIDNDIKKDLLNCIKIGEDLFKEYTVTCIARKAKKLFDKIPKVFKKAKYALKTDKHIDTQIETVNALRYSHELTTVPLYLTKDDFLRKSPKYSHS